MTKQIEDYILVQNLLSGPFCSELVHALESANWQKASWYSYRSDATVHKAEEEPEMLRASRVQQERLNPFVIKALENYQDACGWSGLGRKGENSSLGERWITRISVIRFNRYPVGTRMRQHYDHIQSIFDGQNKGIPIVSVVGNLNEDYVGSEFYCRDIEIPLRTGDVLIFPSNFMFPHAVAPTEEGVRYSFVAWAY